MLFVASSYRLSLDLAILLLLEKHMQLQHHLMFFIRQIKPVHRDKLLIMQSCFILLLDAEWDLSPILSNLNLMRTES